MKTLKPCSNCPFRVDTAPYGLSKKRGNEILDSIYGDSMFHCHKTLDYSLGDGEVTKTSQMCVGSAIFLEQTRAGGMIANVMYRLKMMYQGLRPEHLSKDIEVYRSKKAFLNGACIYFKK